MINGLKNLIPEVRDAASNMFMQTSGSTLDQLFKENLTLMAAKNKENLEVAIDGLSNWRLDKPHAKGDALKDAKLKARQRMNYASLDKAGKELADKEIGETLLISTGSGFLINEDVGSLQKFLSTPKVIDNLDKKTYAALKSGLKKLEDRIGKGSNILSDGKLFSKDGRDIQLKIAGLEANPKTDKNAAIIDTQRKIYHNILKNSGTKGPAVSNEKQKELIDNFAKNHKDPKTKSAAVAAFRTQIANLNKLKNEDPLEFKRRVDQRDYDLSLIHI